MFLGLERWPDRYGWAKDWLAKMFWLAPKGLADRDAPAAQAGGGPNDLCKKNEPPFNGRAAFFCAGHYVAAALGLHWGRGGLSGKLLF